MAIIEGYISIIIDCWNFFGFVKFKLFLLSVNFLLANNRESDTMLLYETGYTR